MLLPRAAQREIGRDQNGDNQTEGLGGMPVNATLGTLPTAQEVEYALRAMAKNKAVGTRRSSRRAAKARLFIEAPAMLTALHGIIAASWWRSEVPQNWKDATIKVPMLLYKEKDDDLMRQLPRYLDRSANPTKTRLLSGVATVLRGEDHTSRGEVRLALP